MVGKLPFPDQVSGLDPCDGCRSGMKRLKAVHWPSNLFEKTVRGGRMPVLRKHEIKGLSVVIDGAVQISSLPLNLDIRLIHAP